MPPRTGASLNPNQGISENTLQDAGVRAITHAFQAGQVLAGEFEGRIGEYSDIKRIVEERLSSIENEELRLSFMVGLVRALSADQYAIKWQLTEEFVNSNEAKTGLLAGTIRGSVKIDPSWAFEKLRNYEDPVVSESAVQGVVKAITDGGDALGAIDIIKRELGDSDVFSIALSHWLSEMQDHPDSSVPANLAKELLTDPRLDSKMKEKFAEIYIQSANEKSPLDMARMLNQEKVVDGGWEHIVAEGAKLGGNEANEFIGLVFNASKYRVADFMGEYMKSNTPKDVFDRFDSYPENARQTMLCAAFPYVVEVDRIPDFLSKVDGLQPEERARTIERVVDYCGRVNIPRPQIELLFQYDGGNPKLDKIYNHYSKGK